MPQGGDGAEVGSAENGSAKLVSLLVDRALSCAATAVGDNRPAEAVKFASEALELEVGNAARQEVLAAILACRSAAHAAASSFELSLDDARDGVATHPTAKVRTALAAVPARTCLFRRPGPSPPTHPLLG